ncbi:MAG: hypothetical protein SF123_25605 [Chloroflexota bacterium]|nr:hypothetical protein [Chloroflexota bacterium]
MLLQDVFKIIDSLTPEEKLQVKAHIEYPPEELAQLKAEIDAILATAEPVTLQAGTMDVDKLIEATRQMWEGLTDEEIDEVVAMMNEEYIEPERPNDG